MRKNKVSHQQKVEAVEKYQRGETSYERIAKEYGVDNSSVRQWAANYEAFGPDEMVKGKTNKQYSVEFKKSAVEAYLQGQGSRRDICKKFKIRSTKQLLDWIKVYTSDKEFQAKVVRGRGIYMTRGRETTLEERIEIVSYCISRGKDYAATIEKYGVSYYQIYSWVAKHEKKGIEGLSDRRGKRKALEDMNELERLKAENKVLKAEKEYKDMEIAVLKKLQEIERRRR